MAIWTAMFLAEKYGRLTLTLDEVAEQIGLSPGTIRNRRMRGEFARLRDIARSPLAHTQIDLCLSSCGRQTMPLYTTPPQADQA